MLRNTAAVVDLLLGVVKQDRHPIRRRRNALMVLLMADAGLSSTEMAGLKLSDVNLREGYLVAGKGRRRRAVPLTSRLADALAGYIDTVGQTDGFLLPGSKGVMSPRGVYNIISALAARAGVKLTPRDLTESFYYTLAQRGVGVETVAALRGVSKLDTVRRFFGTPCDFEKIRESVRLLEVIPDTAEEG